MCPKIILYATPTRTSSWFYDLYTKGLDTRAEITKILDAYHTLKSRYIITNFKSDFDTTPDFTFNISGGQVIVQHYEDGKVLECSFPESFLDNSDDIANPKNRS